MARIRTLKPEFATDEKLAKVSRDARLTFVLAITQADDDGLLPGNHRQLLAALYPMDDSVNFAKLSAWLEELVELGRLRWRETVDGSPILEIVNWANHQRVDHKGKSLIAPHLKPAGEESARDSGESREDVASVSRSDLGPRTVDHGPPTSGAGAPTVARAVRVVRPSAGIETVLAHYVGIHPRRNPGPKDRKAVEKALALGYSPAQLCEAIDGNAADQWHIDKHKHELTYVLRDNGLIDTFREKATAAPDRPYVVNGWFAEAL